jgi:polyhydroxyalkanoate synthase
MDAAMPAVRAKSRAPRSPSPQPRGGDRVPSFRSYDRMLRATRARATQGISPVTVADAWANWALHLAMAPGRQAELALSAANMAARFGLWLPGAVAGNRTSPRQRRHRTIRTSPTRTGNNFRSTRSRKCT